MSSEALNRYDHCLHEGWIVSISQLTSIAERVARVMKSSPEETWLKLSRTDTASPFETGEPVRIKYWDEPVISYWEGKVGKLDRDNQTVAISDQGQGITLGRRRYSRLSLGIPTSFKVTHTSSDVIENHTIYSDRIRNMSAGGLSFDTSLALEVGDELEVKLDLHHLRPLRVGGWVVRSKPVEGDSRYAIALEFLGLEQEERETLLTFLDHYQMGSGSYKITGLYPALPPPAGTVPKRQEQRFHIELMGTAMLDSTNGKQERKITTRNLCASGGYFLTDNSPWEGDQVKIRLQWPSQPEEPDTKFEILGTVLRIEQISEETCGFAVDFHEIIDLDVV